MPPNTIQKVISWFLVKWSEKWSPTRHESDRMKSRIVSTKCIIRNANDLRINHFQWRRKKHTNPTIDVTFQLKFKAAAAGKNADSKKSTTDSRIKEIYWADWILFTINKVQTHGEQYPKRKSSSKRRSSRSCCIVDSIPNANCWICLANAFG